MRNRIAVWGRNAQEQRVLITIELQVSDNIVRIQTYPEKVVSDDVFKSFMDKWRKSEEVELPEPDRVIARELSVTEGLLPDDLRAEQTDMILRAQTEWHYHVLSDKLAQTYKNELAEIEDRIERASEYSSDLWNQAKTFWQKVQSQLQDKTLLREQGNDIRKRVDKSFAKLKEMREVLNEKYKEESVKHVAKFNALLEDAEKRIGEGTHLNKVFNDLRDIQKKFHNVKFTKEDRDVIYSRIDAAFKSVKEKRGQGGGKENRNAGRTQARLDGLQKAMDRMKSGIGRDENDLKFERRRIEKTNGQLEKQIREAKVVMIESRIASKQLKLDDMEKTKAMLVKKIEQEKVKEEKRAKKAAERAAAEAAKAKIAADMATRVVSPEEQAKLEAAAAKIKSAKKKKGGRTKPEDRTPENVKSFVAFSEVINGDAPQPVSSEPEVTEVAAAAATAGTGAPLVNEQAASVAEAISGDSANLTAAEVATKLADSDAKTTDGPEEMSIAETAGSAIASVISTVGGAANSATAEGGLLDQIGDVLSSAGESIADTLEDITDTAKAVAQVASEKINDAAETVEDAVEDAVEDVKEKISGEEE
ncbi:hypothetical protein FUA23_20930 [Neolewinella aurantiaca]|uniref:Uncharacterized protein n=1 Tax=Neolewinella aurantiaca TaxID=2602767 RepID=A0A5C7F346_9BACT|nr:hypothetical protein [Neolewinella aurantiaca]TXF85032.1 hypothetical protein FUA23_20930 [Neolewinella aurantiaca]